MTHGFGIVVRAVAGAAQNQMAIRVAFGFGGNHATVQVNGQEVMLEAGRETGIGGGLDGAVGGVLEAHRHGQATGQFAVDLGFGVTRADGTPADRVADVLRGDGVKPFGGGGQAEAQHVGEHLAGQPHALTNIEATVQIGVVDEAFPADGGARLLEVHAHHDHESVFQLALDGSQLFCVLVRGLRVVD